MYKDVSRTLYKVQFNFNLSSVDTDNGCTDTLYMARLHRKTIQQQQHQKCYIIFSMKERKPSGYFVVETNYCVNRKHCF